MYLTQRKAGDELALEIVDTQARILGRALAQIACVVDPEIFVIGGGVSKAGSILTDSVKKYFEHYAFHACRQTKFALAQLGNDAGIYGSACKHTWKVIDLNVISVKFTSRICENIQRFCERW